MFPAHAVTAGNRRSGGWSANEIKGSNLCVWSSRCFMFFSSYWRLGCSARFMGSWWGEWVNFCVNLNHDCNSELLIGKTEMDVIFLNCVQLCGH